MTETLVITLHVVVAFVLILVVLLQSGKGASMGAAFGGSSQTVFGSRGPAGFMSKLTTAAAIVFMLTSLVLSMIAAGDRQTTIIDEVAPPPVEESSDSSIDPFAAPMAVDELDTVKDTGTPAGEN